MIYLLDKIKKNSIPSLLRYLSQIKKSVLKSRKRKKASNTYYSRI